jgi:C-5 cytosine-specific DNA methylase
VGARPRFKYVVESVAVKPLCVDLYCGLGGWAEGFLAEGYDVVGFDIERHEYGAQKYPGELVLKDVLDITGEQIRALNPRVIVASPPCQEPSYRAMPWKRAKALNVKPPSKFLCLFYACFEIAQDAGVPVIVENVCGAQRWVGPAGWHHGSYYLWGNLPALMPTTRSLKVSGFRFDGSGGSFQTAAVKTVGHANIRNGHSHTRHLTNQRESDAIKVPGNKLSENGFTIPVARMVDKTLKPESFRLSADDRRQHLSYSRKAASAMIAKIPFQLSSHIARCFYGS